MRVAPAAAVALALLLGAAAPAPAADAAADIELRKSFRAAPPARGPSRHSPASPAPGTAAPGGAAGSTTGAPDPAGRAAAGVAAALGEPLRDAGALHLPGVAGRGVVLEGALVPVLEFGNGRRALLDASGRVDAATAADIAARWPSWTVVRPGPGADLKALIGAALDASGYASVSRDGSVVLGRDVTVRLNPDFVVVKDDRDLLEGETRAVSVVDAVRAFPPELRELAAGRSVRTVELAPDGAPVGTDRAPWVDPVGRVTTIASARPAAVLAELAAALGLAAPPAPATPLAAADLGAAIAGLLAGAGLAAVGPTVELYPEPPAGARPRFVIAVPGWLVETTGRRLLITGAEPPPLVRRYLTREGIDLFEYRCGRP
jgi:hypothetical protein